MLLSGVLFVLFLAGCWLYCLTDAALTPAEEFPGWRKRTWIAVIAVTLIAGARARAAPRRNRGGEPVAARRHAPDHHRSQQPQRGLVHALVDRGPGRRGPVPPPGGPLDAGRAARLGTAQGPG